MGRTPYVGQVIRPFLEKEHLLSYIESILRVYNLHGRRDNLNKARIKILVNQLGIDRFRDEVEADWEATRKDAVDLPASEYARIASYFAPPELVPPPEALPPVPVAIPPVAFAVPPVAITAPPVASPPDGLPALD